MDSNTSNNNSPSIIGSIVLFTILSIIYTIIQYFVGKNRENIAKKTTLNIYFIIFISLSLIGKFFINLNITTAKCNTPQWKTALIGTLFPWTVIFGSIFTLLKIFPGWLSPFSNTFGYGIAKLSGLSKLLREIFLDNPKIIPNNKEESVIQEALANIYTDRSLLINEITVDNFDNVWDRLQNLFKKGVFSNTTLKNNLWNIIWLKTNVSKLIWMLLAGILGIVVSYNYVVNSGCEQSSKDMLNRHKEYEKEMKEKQKEKNKENKRIYYTED